jgi:hypothetical protein
MRVLAAFIGWAGASGVRGLTVLTRLLHGLFRRRASFVHMCLQSLPMTVGL